jgi:SH3-like domain-containing protein
MLPRLFPQQKTGKLLIMKRFSLTLIFLFLISAATAMAERLTVIAPVANIRSGPGTQYDVLWQVEKYYPILVTKKLEQWYLFKDFEDDIGWVHKSLIGNVEAIITNKDLCNIRSGPGTNNKILFTVEKGIPFKVLEHKGSWLHIEHADGDKGWIHDSLVW